MCYFYLWIELFLFFYFLIIGSMFRFFYIRRDCKIYDIISDYVTVVYSLFAGSMLIVQFFILNVWSVKRNFFKGKFRSLFRTIKLRWCVLREKVNRERVFKIFAYLIILFNYLVYLVEMRLYIGKMYIRRKVFFEWVISESEMVILIWYMNIMYYVLLIGILN